MDLQGIVDNMTLEQKAQQMTQLATYVLNPETIADPTGPLASMGLTAEAALQCGSVFNIGGAAERIRLQREHLEGDPNRIPLVFMQDVIHGFKTLYPIPLAMACSFDTALVRECAGMAAKEAASSGVDVTFSPMADLTRDARWGRSMEGAGEDPFLGAAMAKAQVEGYRKGRDGFTLGACVKHFAAYGAPEGGRDYYGVDMSEPKLRDDYLPAYRAALEAGACCVMPSFNTLNGVPSVANRALLQGVLRREWGFDGVVVSDYGAVRELIEHGVAEDETDAAELALKAGCDLEMMSACYQHGLKALVDAGRISMAEIDACVLRVLRLKQRLGLFENPMGQADEQAEGCCLSAEHREIARRAAEGAAVLLKNDGVLPLSGDLKRVAVIGPFAQSGGLIGAWSINGKKEDAVTVAQGLKARLPGTDIRVCGGCGAGLLDTGTDGVGKAAALAAWADAVVLCLGEAGEQSGENTSRARLELSDAQEALFRAVNGANPRVAVLLFAGRPLAVPTLAEQARAILCMWQPGTEGGSAAARLLLGDAEPGGRLAMSFPRATGQEPVSYDVLSTGRPTQDWKNPDNNTYQTKWLDCPVAPLYPFGWGLGYTDFTVTREALSAAALRPGEALTATCRVTNVGKRAGTTVVQLYIRDLVGSRARPLRQLKGFEKVALGPGESLEVCFEIDEPMLRFTTLERGYASEKGRFEVFLALNSESGRPLSFTLE